MANSTVTLQSVVDYSRSFGELTPVLGVGGYSQQPALTIANDVMTAMLSQAFDWKWNREKVATFYTNSWQQDYCIYGVTDIAWIEHGFIVDINNTALPKPIFPIEAVRDLERSSASYGRPQQVCWLPNDQLTFASWPGAFITYTDPVGQVAMPANPITQIVDGKGNLQLLTTYGVTGELEPVWPDPATDPLAVPGMTTADGSCVWTMLDPKGQGFRIVTPPSQTGTVYQINVIAQKRPPQFTKMSQTLEPIPDDFASYFRQGFIAYCYRHSPEASIRAKFPIEQQLWVAALQQARGKSDRERDDAGFFPAKGVMDNRFGVPFGPADPYGFWSY